MSLRVPDVPEGTVVVLQKVGPYLQTVRLIDHLPPIPGGLINYADILNIPVFGTGFAIHGGVISLDSNIPTMSDLEIVETACNTYTDDAITGVNAVLSLKADLIGGVIPASQLPGSVDEVLDFNSFANFPLVGVSSKIYVANDTSLVYRWSGSAYVIVSQSLALGNTSSTAFRGDYGLTAYMHSQVVTGNPHGTTKNDIGLGNVDDIADLDKPVSTAVQNAFTAASVAVASSIATATTVIEDYADAGDRTTLASANAHADTGDSNTTSALQVYSNSLAGAALSNAQIYTDNSATTTLNSANTHSDHGDTVAIATSNAYTDARDAIVLSAAELFASNADADILAASKAYADAQSVSAIKLCTTKVDASTGLFPTTGGRGTSGAIRAGDMFFIGVAGTIQDVAYDDHDSIIALQDDPGQDATLWANGERNLGYTPENSANKVSTLTSVSLDAFPNVFAVKTGLALKLDASLVSTVGLSGNYPDLLNIPVFSTVAMSGSYLDLSHLPVIPAAQVQSDWNATNGIGVILNKPALAGVATSGSYLDLADKPFIPASQVNSDWNAVGGAAFILNKPALTIDTLNNVTITSKSSNDILQWSGGSWVNRSLAAAGIQPAGAYITGNQLITLSGDVSGSGTTSIAVTLKSSGVIAATYGSSLKIPQFDVTAAGVITGVREVSIPIVFDASAITTGTIDIARLPAAALERMAIVANQAARYALTTATVQNGDTVKQNDTGEMWYVVDDSNLGNSAGYSVYTAGGASSAPWTGITGKPTTLAGYGLSLLASDVGLGSVTNTSDVNKPVSTLQAAADAAVQAFAIQRVNHTGTQSASTITGLAAVATSGLKSDVGLGSADNTPDVSKPVSTAQAAADAAVLAAAKAYADGLVAGLLDFRGGYDASSNVYPTSSAGGSGPSNAVMKGDVWVVTTAGTLQTDVVKKGDLLLALVDSPGQTDANWSTVSTDLAYTPENTINKVTNLTSPDNIKFPTTLAVATALVAKLDATGNAVSATKLNTARLINGVSFDGTGNITIADNTKEPTITSGTAAQYIRGDKTLSTFMADVLATTLTGFSSATTIPVVAADTVLAGIGKLQGQVTATFCVRGTTYDNSGNAYPSTGGRGASGAPLKGDSWRIGTGGNQGMTGDTLIALVDSPGQTAGNWGKLLGTAGATGNSLARPTQAITSSSGVVSIDLSNGKEVYTLTLSENVTSWSFANPPASGLTAEIRIEITQGASTAYTCVSPASTGRTPGGPWVISSAVGAIESLGISISSAGVRTVFPSGVYG